MISRSLSKKTSTTTLSNADATTNKNINGRPPASATRFQHIGLSFSPNATLHNASKTDSLSLSALPNLDLIPHESLYDFFLISEFALRLCDYIFDRTISQIQIQI